jgi:hypothetical protein
MSKGKDSKESAEVDLFLQKARAVFNESADSLDGQARSRLNRARQAALAELDSGASRLHRWSRWVPATGAAVVAVVAIVLLHGSPEVNQIITPEAVQLDGDFELLMADDSFDMLLELEFYSWVDIDAAMEDESGKGADVG